VEPRETQHHLIIARYRDGVRYSIDIEPQHASCIGEGELSMQYFAYAADSICENKHDVIFLETIDQDIIDIVTLSCRYRLDSNGRLKNRIVVVMKKKEVIDSALKSIESSEVLAEDARKSRLKYKRSSKKYAHLTQIVKTSDINIKEQKKRKDKYTIYIDMNVVYYSMMTWYTRHHPQVKDPILVEAFLFKLGGCDFHDKPFHRVGYRVIAKEFIQQLNTHHRMISGLPIKCEGRGKVFHAQTLQIDRRRYEQFAKAVYSRKDLNARMPKFFTDEVSREKRMVIPRQIMFTLLCIANIPWIRFKYKESILFDPYEYNGFWGYTKKRIPGGPKFPVCSSTDRVPDLEEVFSDEQ